MKQIELSNKYGIQIILSTYGAGIAECWTADREGRFINIAMTVEHPDSSYAGLTLGPVAGRIRNATMNILTTTYPLTRNEGEHHLHGGVGGCSFKDWRLENTSNKEACFSLDLADGEDGYPGNRHIQTRYTLSDDTLTICYTATTDKPTIFSLTNHTYWNLEGDFSKPMTGHLFCLPADYVWVNDGQHIPREKIQADGTVYDYRKPSPIKGDLNHAFEAQTASLYHPASGRLLLLRSGYPCIVVYSGEFLGNGTRLKGNRKAAPCCAVSLEAQELPNAINIQNNTPQNLITLPTEIWKREIAFQFQIVGEQ